jgi:hypothetical protein
MVGNMEEKEREELLNEILEQKKKEKVFDQFKKDLQPGVPGEQPQFRGGLYGWTCPRCGRGLAPFAHSCPCIPMPQPVITCGNIGL